MAEIRILHAPETLGFACRVAAALASAGHSVIRSELGAPARPSRPSEALVAVWSPAMLHDAAAIEEARAALAARLLVPVSVGRVDPPSSFAHLPPIDLAGWNGDAADSRWRFVCEEIDLALRRAPSLVADLYCDDEPVLEGERRAPAAFAAPSRLVAAAAGVVAVVAVAALTGVWLMRGAPEQPAGRPVIAKMAGLAAAADEDGNEDTDKEVDGDRRETPPRPASGPALAADDPRAVDAGAAPAFDPAERLATPGGAFIDAFPEAVSDADDAAGPAESAPLTLRLAAADAVEDLAAPVADADAAGPAAEEPARPPRLPPRPGDDYLGVVFRDCLACPDMVEAPSGAFVIGARDDDPMRRESEGPAQVRLVSGFAIARRETTFAQWEACVADGGCRGYNPDDAGYGRGARPAINVSYADAEAYAAWLSGKTGYRYRLPSETEWEYAARAGASTPYPGGVLSPSHANYAGALVSDEPQPVSIRMTTPAGSYPANAFGLYDAKGNVREWTSDCWTDDHDAARVAYCGARVVKGGGYDSPPEELRPAHREQRPVEARERGLGFRVARDID